tara:strand:+ start:3620 stop:4519 length:900 start_codon:yes stop_codon:yes gene_type:complete
MEDLIVKPFRENDKPMKPIMKGLVSPSWVGMFVGSRGSGKSLSSIRWVNFFQKPKNKKRGKKIKPYFDHVYLINPSYYQDKKNEHMGIDEENIFLNPSNDVIQVLDDEMKSNIEEWEEEEDYKKLYEKFMKHGEECLDNMEVIKLMKENFREPEKKHSSVPPTHLLICDDCASSDLMKQGKSYFNHFVMLSRHRNCSVIINVQYFKAPAVPKIIRDNLTFLCIFKTHDNKSLNEIWEEVSGVLPRKEFLKLYDYATKQKHNFLYINLRDDDEKRFRKNFNEPITPEKLGEVNDEDYVVE